MAAADDEEDDGAENDETIVAKGTFLIVQFATRPFDKRCEAWDWWLELDGKTRICFQAMFNRLADYGEYRNEERFKPLGDDVYEFKKDGHRLLCKRVGRRLLLLTNTLKKNGRKNIENDIQRAIIVAGEHLTWVASKNDKKRLT